jgi:hypothetical protein
MGAKLRERVGKGSEGKRVEGRNNLDGLQAAGVGATVLKGHIESVGGDVEGRSVIVEPSNGGSRLKPIAGARQAAAGWRDP